MNYKILITTSGKGSRLEELTKNLNKSLIPINNKAIIDYIIESYNADIPIVIILGFLGEQVKSYLLKNHPNRKFQFVVDDTYDKVGSLGRSLLEAKSYLQCPFILNVCDTIVTEDIPPPEKNWVGGFSIKKTQESKISTDQYRTHKIQNYKVVDLLDKGIPDFDSIHIGLNGINDYKSFWSVAEEIYDSNPISKNFSDVHILNVMIKKGISFMHVSYNVWLDTGNLESLKNTEKYLNSKK